MSTISPKPVPATSRKTTTSPTPPTRNPSVRTTPGTARTPVTSTPLARRRPPTKPSTPVAQLNGDTKESLSESLKQESAEKELLLLQVQDKEQTISTLSGENSTLTSALNAAETRLNELYAEQSRWEVELAQRIDISDKLREQVRELEKEKRDLQRRYNEQTSTFEAERQAFYDSEQHLKSRIQSLTQARKRAEAAAAKAAEALTPIETTASEPGDSDAPPTPVSERNGSQKPSPDYNDPDNEPAEMTALKLELSTLSTSYTSIQNTLLLLQSQLVDLKRVNHELQEENESYLILLREKTLSGQFDLMRQVGGTKSSESGDSEDDERGTNGDLSSLHSTGRGTLDRVDEEPESLPESLESELARPSRPPSKSGRRRTASSASAPRGESLADLPITGPGLDLAAELGRAENKEIMEGNFVDNHDASPRAKRSKKTSDGKKSTGPDDALPSDIEALRSEVKNLKDANKALSLYASKIIDRIIAQEGFEHVLAADYDQPKTPATAQPPTTNAPPRASPAKPRPQSVLIPRSSVAPDLSTPTNATPQPKTSSNHKRRSLSFDWKTFSFSSTDKKPDPSPNLRPLTLKPGASPIVANARKLETQEDEEDRKERERLAATMKLMGIQSQPSIHSPSIAKTQSEGEKSESSSVSTNANRRFSLWGSRAPATDNNSDAASNHSSGRQSSEVARLGLGLSSTGLTQEALEHVEAENSLAALDAREKNLSQEIAKGGSGGFTEVQRRTGGRRSRRSAGGSGSGSTVFSAGMHDE